MSSSPASLSDDFSRYQTIIDRKPFGEPLPDAKLVTNAAAVPPSDLFTKTLKMVAIKLDKKGQIKVGFINQAAANKGYYLNIGETSNDGIELVEADFKLESALLRKDAQTGWIYMKASQLAGSIAQSNGRDLQSLSSRLSAKNMRGVSYGTSVRRMSDERARLLMERSSARTNISIEDVELQLQAPQMDIIRQGLPALPMPLTKEMDDQLVAEGVLSPVEEHSSPPAEVL